MKLHRFIVDFPLAGDQITIKDSKLAHQIKTVLRLKIGEEFLLADGRGNEARAKIADFENAGFSAVILEKFKNVSEPETKVKLYCAILKRENFELAAQKAVEVGVSEIVPLITRRTVKLAFKKERIETILKEAAEQSGRGLVPVLGEAAKLAEAAKEARQNDLNIFCDASGENIYNILRNTGAKNIGLFVGPEGGWEEGELALAKEAGFSFASLGPTTLRAETAAITASFSTIAFLAKK